MKESDYKITLRAARVNAGLTQKQVAQSVNVCIDTVRSWEIGKSEPSASKFKALCDLYNCPEDFIFLR